MTFLVPSSAQTLSSSDDAMVGVRAKVEATYVFLGMMLGSVMGEEGPQLPPARRCPATLPLGESQLECPLWAWPGAVQGSGPLFWATSPVACSP